MRVQITRPSVSERLRDLANDVRKIGYGWGCDPEQVAIAKDAVAKELLILAREAER